MRLPPDPKYPGDPRVTAYNDGYTAGYAERPDDDNPYTPSGTTWDDEMYYQWYCGHMDGLSQRRIERAGEQPGSGTHGSGEAIPAQ